MRFLKWFAAIVFIVALVPVGLYFTKHVSQPTTSPIPEAAIKASAASSDTNNTPSHSEVHSADGTMKVVMEKTPSSGSDSYVFKVSNIDGSNERTFYTTTLPPTQSMLLPENSFSPDNKYLFISEVGADGKHIFYVFMTNGDTFSDGVSYLDVGQMYAARDHGYNFAEVTGWDSDTLMHVTTTKEDGSLGPHFWFEVPGGAFIQLAR